MEPHIRIINNTAKKLLAPHHIFRIGSSRCWMDDNDYFLTIIEFQPSAYGKGSYLNVGISFLWEKTPALNLLTGFDFGYRVSVNGSEYAAYHDDDKFAKDLETFALAALDKATEYRKFGDLEYAKQMLIQNIETIPHDRCFWELYDLAMLCFFKGDYDDGMRCFDSFMSVLQDSLYQNGILIEWRQTFYEYCHSALLPQLTSAKTAKRTVAAMINRRRSYFNSKKSHMKMKKDLVF